MLYRMFKVVLAKSLQKQPSKSVYPGDHNISLTLDAHMQIRFLVRQPSTHSHELVTH